MNGIFIMKFDRQMDREEKQMKKNVLLLCLSIVSAKEKRKDNYYTYVDEQGEHSVTGYMTNEAPVKSVIERLNRTGTRLDEIVVICSEEVQRKVNAKYLWMEEKKLPSGKTLVQVTHLEYYKEIVNDFAEQLNQGYRDKPIQYYEIPIPDDTESDDIATAVVSAANKVMADRKDVNLYIDFNGGQRYIAFMILSIANLMKIRNVNICDIMTMNYNMQKEKVTPIQSLKHVFETMDLVAGVNEYIHYGRIKMLKNYFADCKNEGIKTILNDMECFANNMQLCRTETVFKGKKTLRRELEAYISNYKKEGQHTDIFETLFFYVVKDILDGYQGLLEGDIPEIVQWCVDKDFVQQALTFYVERMPIYFWDNGIFKPSEQEEEEYKNYLKNGKEAAEKIKLGKEEVAEEEKGWAEAYKQHYKNGNDKYNWMIRYVKYCLRAGEPQKQSFVKRWMECEKNGRATSILQREKLRKVLEAYSELKDQRNATNHASNEKTVPKQWSYDKICQKLRQSADMLTQYEK